MVINKRKRKNQGQERGPTSTQATAPSRRISKTAVKTKRTKCGRWVTWKLNAKPDNVKSQTSEHRYHADEFESEWGEGWGKEAISGRRGKKEEGKKEEIRRGRKRGGV